MRLVILVILPISVLFQQDFYAKVVNRTQRYGPYIAVPVNIKWRSGKFMKWACQSLIVEDGPVDLVNKSRQVGPFDIV
jgi:hypothetical protein